MGFPKAWRVAARRLMAGALVLALAACASVPPAQWRSEQGAIELAPLDVGGTTITAHWYLPAGEARALVLMEHGFARRCQRLRETTRHLMTAGLMALCLDAPMDGGNPRLADALAPLLLGGELRAPDGRALPQRIIVGGHSAGAVFALRLGARLVQAAPERLAGALLLDPVATRGFEADALAVSAAGRRPVLAVLAAAQGCNAGLNALPVLLRVQQAAGAGQLVGAQLTEGATHADAEGEDTDWLATTACGTPRPANTALLRELAVQWALAMAKGQAPALADNPGWRALAP